MYTKNSYNSLRFLLMARTKSQKAKRYAAQTATRLAKARNTRELIHAERIAVKTLRRSTVWNDMENLSQRDKSALSRSELGQSFTRSTVANPHKQTDIIAPDVVMIESKRAASYPSHSRHDIKVRLAGKKLRQYKKACKVAFDWNASRTVEEFKRQHAAESLLLKL